MLVCGDVSVVEDVGTGQMQNVMTIVTCQKTAKQKYDMVTRILPSTTEGMVDGGDSFGLRNYLGTQMGSLSKVCKLKNVQGIEYQEEFPCCTEDQVK